MNSKVDRVDNDAYIKFVGKVKADLKLIKETKSEEDDGTPLVEPAGNDRFEKREMQLKEQNKILQDADKRSKNRDSEPPAAVNNKPEVEGE